MRKLFFFVAFSLFLMGNLRAEPTVPLAKYLQFARQAADWTWDHYDSLITDWQKKLDPDNVFGYRPPSRLLETATIYAFLYEKEQNKEYATRAKKILLEYADFRSFYPDSSVKKRPEYADGVPALPDFFTIMRYIRAYESLNRMGYLNKKEQNEIQQIIAQSTDFIIRTQEWGAMNRGMLRAEGLAWAVKAVPKHKHTPKWKMLLQALVSDNWNKWEIEDATHYNAIWLYSLLGYADAANRTTELFKTPVMFYYARYYLHLMSPAGMLPDFGDAYLNSNWYRFLAFFEAAAAAYNDPNLKWAATTIANKFIDFSNAKNTGLAYILLDCYRWGSDDVSVAEPAELSEEVLEDVVGKKIVFRNGWQSNSTFLLLNYRDEGDGGLIYRDYLRDTIPVEEEKMTHGHADENSIVSLWKNGSLLLHDGGYRDYMPSGPYGAYRQDYFHNRLCVRQEKIWMGQKKGEYRYSVKNQAAVPGQSALDFLHNAGSYRQVRTQKIDFLSFPDFDYSRTRLIDDKLGYEWDRVITYVKNPEMFVIFDIMKARTEDYFTAVNLWHTRKIVDRGEHWYDTVYDSLRNLALPTDTHLLIYFPKTHFRLEGVEKEKRYWQDELAIHQTAAQHFELGENIAFVTVLVPHPAAESAQKWIEKIDFVRCEPARKGLLVKIADGDRTILIGAKRDLRMDIVRDWRRPRYTYEGGRIRYDQLETNGDYMFATLSGNKLDYTAVNLTKLVYNNQVLFEQLPSKYGLAFDGSPDAPGVGKVRYWRDSVKLNR